MKNNFKKTQKGNPHQLTIRQHFIPKESIKRFANNEGKVQAKHLKTKQQKTVFVSPDDGIFYVNRLWDQRAESVYMKKIEDTFQGLVDEVVQDRIKLFDETQSKIICDMYALWEYRILQIEEIFKNPNLSVSLREIKGDALTQDEQEILESKNCMYINEDGDVPKRFFIGFQIQRQIDFSTYSHVQWGIIKSINKEFILPSNPIAQKDTNTTIVFPISPLYCLVPNPIYKVVDDGIIEELNTLMKQDAKWFYVGRNL